MQQSTVHLCAVLFNTEAMMWLRWKKKLKGATRNALLLHNSIHSNGRRWVHQRSSTYTNTITLSRFLARSLGLGKHTTQPPHSVSHSERSDQPKARYATEMLIIASQSPSDFKIYYNAFTTYKTTYSLTQVVAISIKPHQVYGTHLSSPQLPMLRYVKHSYTIHSYLFRLCCRIDAFSFCHICIVHIY